MPWCVRSCASERSDVTFACQIPRPFFETDFTQNFPGQFPITFYPKILGAILKTNLPGDFTGQNQNQK